MKEREAKQKKKIDLICLPADKRGGAEGILKMIAMQSANTTTVHVVILSCKTDGFWESMPERIVIHYLNLENLKSGWIKLLKKLAWLSIHYDIRFIFSSQSYLNGIIGFSRRLKILTCQKLIVRESTNVFSRFKGIKRFSYTIPYYLGYRDVDLVICQTAKMKEELLHKFHWFSSLDSRVIRNPVNLEEIAKKKVREPEIDIQSYQPYIIAAGRLIPEKGFDILIRAFKELGHRVNDYQLLILGEGKERQSLKRLVNELQLNNKVHLPGHVKNVYPFFLHASLCVVSSIQEGFPNVLLQMMAVNDNVLSTKCVEDLEKINELQVCLSKSPQELFESMENALSKNHKNPLARKEFDHYLSKSTPDSYYKSIISALKEPFLIQERKEIKLFGRSNI